MIKDNVKQIEKKITSLQKNIIRKQNAFAVWETESGALSM